MNFVLSFDKTTNITRGFLSYSSWVGSRYQLFPRLLQASELAINPMLLPALVNSAWSSLMTESYFTAKSIILYEIERETGLMKDNFRSEASNPRSESHVKEKEQQEKHNKIHAKIVSQHAYLCTGLSDYVKDDGEAILAKLEEFDESKEKRELQTFMERQIQNTRC